MTPAQAPSLATWKERARSLKTEVHALYLAARDPRVPWYVKTAAACVVAYAFSPMDLIPDFVPVLGHLDDLILLPLGVLLVRRMIPPDVLADCRARASSAEKRTSWIAAATIVFVWLCAAAAVTAWWLHAPS